MTTDNENHPSSAPAQDRANNRLVIKAAVECLQEREGDFCTISGLVLRDLIDVAIQSAPDSAASQAVDVEVLKKAEQNFKLIMTMSGTGAEGASNPEFTRFINLESLARTAMLDVKRAIELLRTEPAKDK